MKGKRITFPMNPVLRSIIEHARASKEFSPAFGAEPEPALFFVKDDGIYLMSAGNPGLRTPDGKRNVVAYARSFEPDAPGSWERCRDAVGGDDFGEALPLKFFVDALDKGALSVVLIVTEKNIGMEAVLPTRGARC